MLTGYDYAVIIFYFVFIGVVGFLFKKVNNNTSDYFRGGGSMTWWLAGASSFISAISCYTFVSFAGRIYRYGTFWLIATPFTLIMSLIVVFFFAARYRRMRVVTPVEAVRRRFGKGAEQLLAWQRVLVVFVFGGSWLYIMSVFLAPLTGWSVATCILVSGSVVTVMSVGGGSWAVSASDFVQALLVLVITMIAAVYIFSMPELGSWSEIYAKLPERMKDWTVVEREPVIWFMLIQLCIGAFLPAANFMDEGRKYLSAKSDRDAKLAAWCVVAGGIAGFFIWHIPMVLSSVIIPDIYNMAPYSALKNPEEASYVALCISVLPTGMIGLMVCTLFAATMSSMDTRLNMTSGIIVRNIYRPLFNPAASDETMMRIGKIMTGVLGVVCIISGLFFDKLTKLPTNDIYMYMNLYVFSPMVIPMCLAILVRRTPKWAFFGATLAAMLVTIITEFAFDAESFSIYMGWGGELNEREMLDVDITFRSLMVTLAGVLTFVVSTFFYKGEKDQEYRKNAEEFFKDMDTPVLSNSAEHAHTDLFQFRTIGGMALVYGAFILLGVLIPNPLSGRIAFLLAGGSIFGIGALLWWNYKQLQRKMKEQ